MAYIDEGMIKDQYDQIKTNIRKFREKKRISQRELEIDTGIGHSRISKIEKGEADRLLVKELMLISGALEIPVLWLFEGEGGWIENKEEYLRREEEHLERVTKFAKEEFRRTTGKDRIPENKQ